MITSLLRWKDLHALKIRMSAMPRFLRGIYGAQNEAYKMMEGRKVGKVVSLQRVMRGLMVEAPQNETFTLV